MYDNDQWKPTEDALKLRKRNSCLQQSLGSIYKFANKANYMHQSFYRSPFVMTYIKCVKYIQIQQAML